jgi:hypothetical protein
MMKLFALLFQQTTEPPAEEPQTMSLPNTDAASQALKDAVARTVALIQSLQGQVAQLQNNSVAAQQQQQADDQAAAADIQPSIDALNAAAGAQQSLSQS